MLYRSALLCAVLAVTPHTIEAQRASAPPTTFVIVHGAWGGSWDWKAIDSLLTRQGQLVYRPALTGLGERVHLASGDIGLETHITDVVNTILWEDLRDVVLVGHSYGGMVITGVADRIPERIRRLVYLDAFLPVSGESVMALAERIGAAGLLQNIQNGFIVPSWVPPDAPVPHDVPHPLRTFADTLRLQHPNPGPVPAIYILTVEPGKEPDAFQPFADRAATWGWSVRKLAADHIPERSARAALAKMLMATR